MRGFIDFKKRKKDTAKLPNTISLSTVIILRTHRDSSRAINSAPGTELKTLRNAKSSSVRRTVGAPYLEIEKKESGDP